MKDFTNGYCLLQLRKQLRLNQQAMADLMDLTKVQYRSIETSQRSLKYSELVHFFNKMDIPLRLYTNITEYIKANVRTDSEYTPTSTKYFGCMLPIPHLQNVTITLLKLGFEIEAYLLKKDKS